MADGSRYVTGWADVGVLVEWLHRPVFYCARVTIDGITGIVRHKSGSTYTRDSGSGRWINRAVAADYPWRKPPVLRLVRSDVHSRTTVRP
jgi:hypothetical protein